MLVADVGGEDASEHHRDAYATDSRAAIHDRRPLRGAGEQQLRAELLCVHLPADRVNRHGAGVLRAEAVRGGGTEVEGQGVIRGGGGAYLRGGAYERGGVWERGGAWTSGDAYARAAF